MCWDFFPRFSWITLFKQSAAEGWGLRISFVSAIHLCQTPKCTDKQPEHMTGRYTWPNLSCLLGLRLMLLKKKNQLPLRFFLSPLGLPDCLQYDQCTCCWVEQKFKNKVGHKESRQRSKYERRGRAWNDNTADILAGHRYCRTLFTTFTPIVCYCIKQHWCLSFGSSLVLKPMTMQFCTCSDQLKDWIMWEG